MNWLIDIDRALGTSHAGGSQGCQDNISYQSTRNKHWHSICLSDGAGSAKYSEVSSKYVSESFCRSLIELSSAIDSKGPGSWINDQIISNVLALRLGLKDLTTASELDDYHCTLVALLIGKKVSIAVHIGDGAIIAGKSISHTKDSTAINGKIYTSLPENGEYKNETYFITEPHWLKHLRIKVFGEIDWFVMGSDGGMDVLCDREKLDGGLVAELIQNMGDTFGQTSTVTQLITSEFATKKTNDDISCGIGFVENNFTGTDLVWDNQLSSTVNLCADQSAQSLVVSVAPFVIQGSNSAPTSNNTVLASKFSLLRLYNATLLISFLSFFVGGTVSYFFLENVTNFYFQTDGSVQKPDPHLEEPKPNVDPRLDQLEPKVDPELDPSDQEIENDQSFFRRTTDKLWAWWEGSFGLDLQRDKKSHPEGMQVLEQNDV